MKNANGITYLEAKHFKDEAAKDDIQVSIKIIDAIVYLTVGNSKYWYETKEGALRAIQALQSQIAPVKAVRS